MVDQQWPLLPVQSYHGQTFYNLPAFITSATLSHPDILQSSCLYYQCSVIMDKHSTIFLPLLPVQHYHIQTFYNLPAFITSAMLSWPNILQSYRFYFQCNIVMVKYSTIFWPLLPIQHYHCHTLYNLKAFITCVILWLIILQSSHLCFQCNVMANHSTILLLLSEC